MEVKIGSSKLVKPFYDGTPPSTTYYIPLSIFDKVTYDHHEAQISVYRPPNPSNATIELGLRKVLAVYRELAGRLGKDSNAELIILLNDEGVRFVEASVDGELDETVVFAPSTSLMSLHPSLDGVVELVQVQITRFSCGSMVVGFSGHHLVADAHATSNSLIAWGEASRGLEISPLPFRDRTIFSPRNPAKFVFEHRGVEYITKNFKKKMDYHRHHLTDQSVDHIVSHKIHYDAEFINKVKAKASSMNGNNKPFSTFESVTAHLWRVITKARGLDRLENTQVRIYVDGRARLNPKVPNEYFGNLVLWAFAKAKVDDLLREPLPYAARLLHEAVIDVNDDYFKSFIDFASHKVREEDLIPNADTEDPILKPDLEVVSWLRFPFYDIDFGGGCPYIYMPSFTPIEGLIYLLPSFNGNGSIDVCVSLFHNNLETLKQICYILD